MSTFLSIIGWLIVLGVAIPILSLVVMAIWSVRDKFRPAPPPEPEEKPYRDSDNILKEEQLDALIDKALARYNLPVLDTYTDAFRSAVKSSKFLLREEGRAQAFIYDVFQTLHTAISPYLQKSFSSPLAAGMGGLCTTGGKFVGEYVLDRPFPIAYSLVEKGANKNATFRDIVAMHKMQDRFNAAHSKFSNIPVPIEWDAETRYAHSIIVGAVRSGKTTLISHLCGFDIHDPDPPSLILIDPKRLAIDALSRLAIFEKNPERLFIISPHDAPAINIFDTTNTAVGIVDSITYLCSMLGQDMTGKQRGLFRNVANLITNFRKARGTNATLFDLKELMVDKFPDQYRDILPYLEPEQRAFFENKGRDFESRDYRETKDQINTRLNGLTNPHLLPMLRAKESAFNLFDELQKGSVFLVDTAEDILDADESAMFGVIVIAELMRVIRQRLTLPPEKRHKTYVYIDEAQEFFTSADLLSRFMTQGRQCHVGGVFAFHTLDQADAKLRSALITNTATKIVAKYAVDEITYLHDHMGFGTPTDMRDALKEMPEFHWACSIRGTANRAVTITAPEKPLDKYPKMSETAHEKLLERNRQRVSGGQRRQEQPQQPRTPTTPPPRQESKEPPHRWTEQDEQALADAEHQCAIMRRRGNRKRVEELETIIAEAKARKKLSDEFYGEEYRL